MTPELNDRWKSAKAPFSGMTVASREGLSLCTLGDVLSCCLESLAPDYPVILLNHDWHEHDGFINNAEPFDWDQFSRWISNTESLVASRDDDQEVRITIYPETFDWLLRYNIDNDDELCCDFDFSAGTSSGAAELVDRISAKWPGQTMRSNSKEFFDDSYGG